MTNQTSLTSLFVLSDYEWLEKDNDNVRAVYIQ